MTVAIALVLTLAGALSLRLAWHWGRQSDSVRQVVLRLSGWGLVIASLVPWSIAGGPDRGPALALLVFMLTGLALVLREGWRASRTPARSRRGRSERDEPIRPIEGSDTSLLLKRIWIFCLAGPVALAAALALGVALWLALARAGLAEANVLATAMLSVPLLWALLCVAATMQGRLAARTITVALPGLAGLGVAMVFVGGGA